jgi:HlyD family secretion protein
MAEMMKKITGTLKRRRTSLIILLVLIAGGVTAFFIWGDKTSASDYITGKVERGNVEVTVSATGTVQAVVTVQVGSQVSGTVSWLGADFNSQVKKGQIVARLDPAIFQAQVDNSRANVANAEAAITAAQTDIVNQQANLKASKANLEVTRVQRDDALAVVKRYRDLQNVIPSRDIESAQATANAAAARVDQAAAQVGQVDAGVASSRAKLEQAKAGLAQAKAQLQQSTANLDHSIIASPIDGVVVARAVDVGQTVAASLQAPTLFTIANDLTKMQVLASIDEADVGQIRQGIKANFTVDAYPGESFNGEITQLRLNAQALQNVVTYSAVIDVANPELKLRPGMTANITIPVARRESVLTVPNAALRFKPNLSEKEQAALQEKMAERRKQREGDGQSRGAQDGQQNSQPSAEGQQGQRRGPRNANAAEQPQGDQSNANAAAQPPAGGARGQGQGGQNGEGGQGGQGGQRRQGQGGQMVWVMVGKTIEPRFVRTGLTNGRVTEIIAGELNEGDTIIIGQNDSGSRSQQPSSTPFGQRPGVGGGGGRPR